jgi:hypothetical protein
VRTEPTRIRFSKAELDAFRARADANGKHMSTYIREAALAHSKVGLDDAVANEFRRDLRQLQQSFDGFDLTLVEILFLLREVLGKHDPQALVRIQSKIQSLKPRSKAND